MRFYITIFGLFFFFQSYSQNTENQEKIKNSIENYFHYDREIIHVHFNKTIFVNNEEIGLKGYVYSKNNSSPHLYTANVQLVIYNEQNVVIQKQLLFTTLGTFEGVIHLNEKFKSGKYKFHFYTNWMYNFKEDDSFQQTIEIINKNENYSFDSNQPNLNTAKVSFFPESGVIINDVVNIVGVKITDCNHKGITISDGIIIDSKSKEIAKFSTNKMGNGNFYFTPIPNEKYFIKIHSDKINVSEPLPKSNDAGMKISYNNNLSNNHLVISVNTNDSGVALYENKKYILLIHQDGNSIQKVFTFNNKEREQILYFDKKYLSNGVNTIRVIDENQNEVAERMVYIYGTQKPNFKFEAKKIANDSISISGYSDLKESNLSLSVLPENNSCAGQKRSILGTFYLNAYLDHPEIETYPYYDFENNSRNQDMELLMLNQHRSKYLWNDIITNPPKMNYRFTKGVTISGKVEKKLNPKSKYKISLISLNENVFDETTIDENNEFKFKNYFAQDSTVFLLQMLNEKNMTIYTKIAVKLIRNDTLIKQLLHNEKTNCPPIKNLENNFTFTTSKSDGEIINLSEVKVKNKYKKEVFTHGNEVGSISASAYKIDENAFGNVLEFIGRNGYKTGISQEDNSAFIKNPRNGAFSENGAAPAVYIDNEIVFDLNLLYSLYLNEVDEIYIDKTGFSSARGSSGTINIYLKKGVKNDYFRTKHTSLIVTSGFSKNNDFKNSQFDTQKEFYAFGTLGWYPKILLKDTPNFEVSFPKGNQSEIQVLLEGFTNDGQLISEIKKIPIGKTP
jgi:hypothetical protein